MPDKPNPSDVRTAVGIYVRSAYSDSPLPPTIAKRVDQLTKVSDEEFYSCPAFERDDKHIPTRYSVRLGNPRYPHMKLVIDPCPDGNGYLFRADCHDRHICPAVGSKEYELFRQLMENNQTYAQKIETAWANAGTATLKTFLRDDLARRTLAKTT